jgi:hypothetical protein
MAQKTSALAQRATKLAASRTAPPAKTPSPRVNPVKLTLPLAPQTYRWLTGWAATQAERAELTRLPLTEVLRELVNQLQNDPDLQERVAREAAARHR